MPKNSKPAFGDVVYVTLADGENYRRSAVIKDVRMDGSCLLLVMGKEGQTHNSTRYHDSMVQGTEVGQWSYNK